MNILVSNDDGIYADGIKNLVKALSNVANVYVCAPHTQRSASGHSITINSEIAVKEVEYENAKLALEITGTPADCVKLGLIILDKRGIKIDMVFSGINHGGNLGTDTLYSGTVSAAIEGAICGKPSVAVSVNSHFPKTFEMACDLAIKACKGVYGKMDSKTVLNINVPDLPPEEVKGVRITRLGAREYDGGYEPKANDDGSSTYVYAGKPVFYAGLPGDIDVASMQEGYASITPLHYDLTSYTLIEEVKTWNII